MYFGSFNLADCFLYFSSLVEFHQTSSFWLIFYLDTCFIPLLSNLLSLFIFYFGVHFGVKLILKVETSKSLTAME